MVMALRPFVSKDFLTVAGWWFEHHGNDFRPGFVAPAAYIVELDGKPAGFFSMHDMQCDFCYFGFPLVNPNLSREDRESVVDFMIESAKLWAIGAGFPLIYISIRGEKFLSRLRTKGFITGESGNFHMFCKLGEIK